MTITSKVRFLEPAYLATDDLPWCTFKPWSETVKVKVLRVNYQSGEVVLMLKAPANQKLGTHIHHGPLVIYTISGNWWYPEHEWKAKKGDVVYEISDSKHTFVSLEGEEIVLFIVLQGAIEWLDDNGKTLALETLHSWIDRYEAHCIEHGIPIQDLSQFPQGDRPV